jgi:division protein CdvB (Snf7/Vps24/ESCRT-III family)
METEKFAKQVIDFQKATFDNTFTAVTMLQDQTERMVNTMIEQATWLPEESRRAIDEMVGTYKKGRADFKGVIDENFVKLADLVEAVPTLEKPQVSTLEAVPTLKKPQTSPMSNTK